MSEAKWYVVHTYSGYENIVKTNIDKTIENRGFEEQILEVRIPMQEVTEVTRTGTQRVSQRKIFPGYVFVHMIMNDETWYVVRNTRGVTGFVGPGSKPVPLTDAEIRSMGIADTKVVENYKAGETIVVISGAWKDTVGMVKEVNSQKQTLTINVELFGRETPVEIQFSEVKKM